MSTYIAQSRRAQVRSKWPFPPSPRPRHRQPGQLSRGAMVADVILVAVWGASIPGLMWLGTAVGF